MNCRKVESDDGVRLDGEYMSSQPDERCWKEGEAQSNLLPFGIIL